jgi:protein TonB
VPVTIVTEGPTNVRPAIEDGRVDQTAQTEEPTPEADPSAAGSRARTGPDARSGAAQDGPDAGPHAQADAAEAGTPKPAKPEPDFFASLEKTLAKTPKATGKPVANAAQGPDPSRDRHPGPSRAPAP